MDAPLTLEESAEWGKPFYFLVFINAIPYPCTLLVLFRENFCSSLFCGICISLNGLDLKMTLNSLKSSLRDEYKEFEKLIQEDLQEVDNRLEEEEVMIIISLCYIIELVEFLTLICICTINLKYDEIFVVMGRLMRPK